jgi:hypothetical protein
MKALTGPTRWGIVPVDVVFGEVRYRPGRLVLCTGDTVMYEGEICVFLYRENDDVTMTLLEEYEEV